MAPAPSLTLLNGLTPAEFLRDYWQKKPLLIRGAIPGFTGLLSPDELAGLACEALVPSRLIQHQPQADSITGQWQVTHGPLDEAVFSQLPANNWTLLVQHLDHVLPEARALLAQFSFIPHARLDDLMVSYAPRGGGVGPHVDSYDVFLLQGAGQRRWRISQQHDHHLLPGAPLRILSNFVCEQEWVLSAGDMLYLPPSVAHWGIAEDDACMTYSVGFRAPAARELAIEYLETCRQQDLPDQMYQDPDLQVSTDPSEIDAAMVTNVRHMLTQLDWSATPLGIFLARYLSEPKSHVTFQPARKMALARFMHMARAQGIMLDLQSQLLHWQQHYFLNGEAVPAAVTAIEYLQSLALHRQLLPAQMTACTCTGFQNWLHEGYLAGYLHLTNT